LLIFRKFGRCFRHVLLVRPQVGLGVALAVGNTIVVVYKKAFHYSSNSGNKDEMG
jgi:hypothetical protein